MGTPFSSWILTSSCARIQFITWWTFRACWFSSHCGLFAHVGIVDFSRMLANGPFIASEEQMDIYEHSSAPRNGTRRVNSRCCFVPATKSAISAFMVLQSHALANSNSSEEPSFFNVFCLPPWGSESPPSQGCVCVSTAGALQVKFLDSSAFAQGSVFLSQEDPAFTGVLYHN